ncbi:DUF833 domain-containing protein [Xylariales sp. PMI_506]|nr:DUF833 domain-containing protein [Xylariales sp. PMI_506]
MCIALVTTSHPKYALILIDNRDEYVLRPTSRPHWWVHHPSGHKVLSSRDLLRRERGTWMGVTEQGRLAVLTNYREREVSDETHMVHGIKSRGAIVNSWLGAPDGENLDDFMTRMVEGQILKGVGGFSLICGDLKPKGKNNIEPLAIISNRSDALDGIPRIASERSGTWALSNSVYESLPPWIKIESGKKLLQEAIQKAVDTGADQDRLCQLLYEVLDTNTMPPRGVGMDQEDYYDLMRRSIFVPAISDEQKDKEMEQARMDGEGKAAFYDIEDESREALDKLPPDSAAMFESGAYGTQRQTIILVDWDGTLTYRERALWDSHGNLIERGKGDVTISFKIDSWKRQENGV